MADRHLFNGPLSRTTRVRQYQKDNQYGFTGTRDSEWQWHQLGHMQTCTSPQADNHDSTPPVSFHRPDALPAAQPTVSKYRTQSDGRQQSYSYVAELDNANVHHFPNMGCATNLLANNQAL